MARLDDMKKNKYNQAAVGSLAFDYDYFERQNTSEKERREAEYRERARRAEEYVRPPQPRKRAAAAPQKRVRERQKVSGLTVLACAALAVLTVALLMSYARLTALSAEVVDMQSELSLLEGEHVQLLTQYEQTFDLATVKAAAANAGMYKPSTSQVFYIDLSAPDSVVVYERQDVSVLSRIFTSLGQGVCAAVEYFR